MNKVTRGIIETTVESQFLKPCGQCGGTNITWRRTDVGYYGEGKHEHLLYCGDCWIQPITSIVSHGDTKEKAIKEWNSVNTDNSRDERNDTII